MNRLTYIDHSYHVRTGSTRFLLERLRRSFQVTEIWDESWMDGKSRETAIAANAIESDVIVIFQMLYDADYLREFQCQNIWLVPMFDGCGKWPLERWAGYRGYGFISFSSTLHRRLLLLGIDSFFLRFYPNPAEYKGYQDAKEDRVFFWERTGMITWNKVKQALGSNGKREYHLHRAIDPGYSLSSLDSEDQANTRITTSEWFGNHEDYLKVVARCQIYVAPRPKEGIGMSFLEAMALGCIVIAQDYPTMNEYIKNKKTGILVQWDEGIPTISPKHVSSRIGARAQRSVTEGRKVFERRLELLIGYLQRGRISPRSWVPVRLVLWADQGTAYARRVLAGIARRLFSWTRL